MKAASVLFCFLVFASQLSPTLGSTLGVRPQPGLDVATRQQEANRNRSGARSSQGQSAKANGLSPSLLRRVESISQTALIGLVALQDMHDGSFQLGKAINPAPVAVSALATLALMSCGEIPGRTRYGRNVELGIYYLLDKQDTTSKARRGYIALEEDRYSHMHGHGYATTALAQALGMLSNDPDALVRAKELRTAVSSAVRIILASQDPETGGWSYDPVPRDHEGSVTITMVQALRAAQNAGIPVDSAAIDKAVRYVERSQKPDGSFRYSLGSNRSSVALTAAAVATLEAAGRYDSRILQKGRAFLIDRPQIFARMGQRRSAQSPYPYYERLYLGEALFFARDLSSFRRWYAGLVDMLALSQDPETGTWYSAKYSRAYATAINLIVLTLPHQYLPIHQR